MVVAYSNDFCAAVSWDLDRFRPEFLRSIFYLHAFLINNRGAPVGPMHGKFLLLSDEAGGMLRV